MTTFGKARKARLSGLGNQYLVCEIRVSGFSRFRARLKKRLNMKL
jgi:hypothetical protein